MDPNTFWSNLDPDTGVYVLNFKKKFFKLFLEENIFFTIFFNYKKIMALQDIFSQLSLCVTCVDPDNGYVFGIRIHKGPEYGSHLDPDLQHLIKLL